MKEIDYAKLKDFDAKRKLKSVLGYQYLPYAPLICALKMSDWRLRDVLEFLYTEVEEFTQIQKENRIDNKDLSKMIIYWRQKNLINFEQVEEEKKKIRGLLVEQKREISSYATGATLGARFSKLDFMKALEKRGVIINSELEGIKSFFDEFASRNDLDTLVSNYLSQKSGFIVG